MPNYVIPFSFFARSRRLYKKKKKKKPVLGDIDNEFVNYFYFSAIPRRFGAGGGQGI